jgi:hypothetical protein
VRSSGRRGRTAPSAIKADIAEAERLIIELRIKIAVSESAGEGTLESQVRLQEMFRVLLLLQDQRDKAELGEAAPLSLSGRHPDSVLARKTLVEQHR